jgi:hypothetical protein
MDSPEGIVVPGDTVGVDADQMGDPPLVRTSHESLASTSCVPAPPFVAVLKTATFFAV